MMKVKALILSHTVFAFCLSALGPVDDITLESWDDLCDKGLYEPVLKQHYEIMNHGDSLDNDKAHKWREGRLASHFEFPLAWIEDAYLKKSFSASEPEQEPRLHNRIKLEMKMYVRARIDSAIFEDEGYRHVLPLLKWLQTEKLRKTCATVSYKVYNTLMGSAMFEMLTLMAQDKKMIDSSNYPLACSVLVHPETIMKISLNKKSSLSYVFPSNWYKPGISIDDSYELSKPFPLLLKTIHEGRTKSWVYAWEELKNFGLENLE